MSREPSPPSHRSILIVGASRGLGHAMAVEFVGRGWSVVGTVRNGATDLHSFAAAHADKLSIETLDITRPDDIVALRDRLVERSFDMVFVNAGTADPSSAATIAEVSTEEFVRVMVTNTLGVMRAVEGLADLARPDGAIGVMSSGQGSLENNTRGGGQDVYRASKAALNQCMRSYAARHADGKRGMLLMAPGWIRTELGGPDAPFSLEETIPRIVDVLIAQLGEPGLRYLDRNGRTVPW